MSKSKQPSTPIVRHVEHSEWIKEATRLFGTDPMKWRFVCPVCGHVASTKDWHDAGASQDAVAFSCVGRWIPGSRSAFSETGNGPCDYAGGGLFRLNPVSVLHDDKTYQVFEFDLSDIENKGKTL